MSDHQYFRPLSDPVAEAMAAHLYRKWQEHEAIVAEWSDPTPNSWDALEPEIQRGYRALALAALEFVRERNNG